MNSVYKKAADIARRHSEITAFVAIYALLFAAWNLAGVLPGLAGPLAAPALAAPAYGPGSIASGTGLTAAVLQSASLARAKDRGLDWPDRGGPMKATRYRGHNANDCYGSTPNSVHSLTARAGSY